MKYKGIVHNILNDAPFIGALVIADACSKACPECINEHLKDESYTCVSEPHEIIDKVKKNGLNQGIILSGLEWSEQPKDLESLVDEALNRELQVMVYTHHDENKFFQMVPGLKDKDVYVKFGLYNPNLKSSDHFSHGVKLATTNQYIKFFGGDGE